MSKKTTPAEPVNPHEKATGVLAIVADMAILRKRVNDCVLATDDNGGETEWVALHKMLNEAEQHAGNSISTLMDVATRLFLLYAQFDSEGREHLAEPWDAPD